ncbi:MAG TPA: biopolymer transporter ExbD [Longimicrobiales bacterium]|nr:biopolymer transporter ExbD [Longimicrobiales bacterium]
MAISMGKTGRNDISEPNITPMIDVLLVLLVIFIIAQPLLQKTMDVQLPKEDKNPQQAPPTAQIILQIEPGGVYKINTVQIPKQQLAAKLQQIYANRPQKIIFVKGDANVVYQDVIDAMDMARGAGVKVIGAVLPGQEAQLGLK